MPTIAGEIKRYYRDRNLDVPRDLQDLTLAVERARVDLETRLPQPDRGEIAEQREVDGRTSSKRYRHVAPSARILTRVLTPREHLALRLRFAHDLTQQKIGDLSGSARCGYGTSSIVASTAPQPG